MRQERNGQAAVAIRAWLEREKPDLLIVPNGTILEMGVAWQIATQMGGIKTVTFEFADQQERIWLAQNDEIMSHHTTALWEGLGNQALPEKAKKKSCWGSSQPESMPNYGGAISPANGSKTRSKVATACAKA